MTNEERAEEYIMREDVVTENDRVPVDNGYGWQTVSFEDEVKQAFQDGAKWGMEHAVEWHDLRKDPTDLPKEDCETVTLHENGNKNIIKWKHGEWTNAIVIPVIAWCELPKFKE